MRIGSRSLPASLASVAEELELRQPKIVTKEMLRTILSKKGINLNEGDVANRLQKHGWLLSLKTMGAWEFAPGSRAGALGSGDRFIELRATLLRRPGFQVAIACESAVWLHGLGRRAPNKNVLAVPQGVIAPPALQGFRITRNWGRLSATLIDSLPVWRIETLLVLIAAHPTSYRAWPTIGEWLDEVARRAEEAAILEELSGRSSATWARMGYILEIVGQLKIANRLHAQPQPRKRGPFYLGPRNATTTYSQRWNILDSLLARNYRRHVGQFQPKSS